MWVLDGVFVILVHKGTMITGCCACFLLMVVSVGSAGSVVSAVFVGSSVLVVSAVFGGRKIINSKL